MATTLYVSASTNRFSGAADVSPESLVIFGSAQLIATWDLADDRDRGVAQTLPGHQGTLTALRFASKSQFVSGDDKGVLRVWSNSDNLGSQWKSTGSIQAHTRPISALCVYEREEVLLVASGSSDGMVKVWSLKTTGEQDKFESLQTISLDNRYPLAIAMASLPQSNALVLAIGGTSRSIQIWTLSDTFFIRSAVLSGHEDWIRGLAFHIDESAQRQTLVLASGSQDATIRLWNIEPLSKTTPTSYSNGVNDTPSDDLLDTFEASLGDLGDAEEGGRQVSLKRHIITVKSLQNSTQQFSITFDALLIGHEAGITSLSWRPHRASDTHPTLLSTSTDSSVILWSPSTILLSKSPFNSASSPVTSPSTSSIWINRQRFGDIGGQRLGGFIGGLWVRDGDEVLGWGWAGGWRRWRCCSPTKDTVLESWVEVGAVSGHNGPVKGLCWSSGGEYLLSAGVDQTTRIHGPIPGVQGQGHELTTWHELGRPQVHGYDLLDVAFLDDLSFVSIADEKVIRVFEAPKRFVDMVERLGVAKFTDEQWDRPAAANVPPLGLSNKAIDGAARASLEDDTTTRRPFEGELAAFTLWPEIEKVFGHGYESISLATSTSKQFVATACKSTSLEHAVIRIYDIHTWQLVGQPLHGHSLTVTRIAFSPPDDQYVLSVSRDRSWMISKRIVEDGTFVGYKPLVANKSHARIIWDCAWAREGDVFATASRDKTVKIWYPQHDGEKQRWIAICTIKTKDAATAVDFTHVDKHNLRRLAIGLESGEILLYINDPSSPSKWLLERELDNGIAHVSQVHRLSWCPSPGENSLKLASCSEDGTLKVLLFN